MRYLANMLTAGEEVVAALERMLAMRAYMRAKTIDGVIDHPRSPRASASPPKRSMKCIRSWRSPNYEDLCHPDLASRGRGDAYGIRGACGFSFGNEGLGWAHRAILSGR